MAFEDRWLDVNNLAECLGDSRETIYAWLTKRALPDHRVRKFWELKCEEIKEWGPEGAAIIL